MSEDVKGHDPSGQPEQVTDLSPPGVLVSVCSHALRLLHPREGTVDRVCRVGRGWSHHPLLPGGQAPPTHQAATLTQP